MGKAMLWLEATTEVLNSLILSQKEMRKWWKRSWGKEYSLQFGFMLVRCTIDAVFILRQLQENHVDKNQNLCLAFVDLESAFDWVPRKVIWWAMQKRGIEEWIVRFVQAMYNSTRSKVRVLHWTPWEFLYGVDLVIITETEDELKMKLIKWKINLEAKGSTWMQKTKIMVSVVDL